MSFKWKGTTLSFKAAVTNGDPRAISSPSPVFINEVLLKHSYVHLITCRPWLFGATMAGLVGMAETIWPIDLKYFLPGHLEEKFC